MATQRSSNKPAPPLYREETAAIRTKEVEKEEPSSTTTAITTTLCCYCCGALAVTRIHVHLLSLIALLFLALLAMASSFSVDPPQPRRVPPATAKQKRSGGGGGGPAKYLYWGYRIDCPGKHCAACEGLGHQESSLRCALEEALALDRTFVIPARMCINQHHNDKGLLHSSHNKDGFQSWGGDSCSMDSLYDLALISKTVPVILDESSEWLSALSRAHRSGGMIHVEGVSRFELSQNPTYSNAFIINRTANSLSWFLECKDRLNHSSVLLPYSFLPKSAAQPLQKAAKKIESLLGGDYDAIHVRRGDKLKVRKDRFGVKRTLLPHLDRDTQPYAIMRRIAKWIPEGRTLFIASNERRPGFFHPLHTKYKVYYASNFTGVLDPIVHNNYELFMIERLVLFGGKTFIKTFKEEPSDLSLTDDGKKKIRAWEIPVYTFEPEPSSTL